VCKKVTQEKKGSCRKRTCGPLKEHSRMANSRPNCIRDTPLVPRGHGGGSYYYPPAAPTNRHGAMGLDIGLIDLTKEFWSQVGTFFQAAWAQHGTKIAPTLHQNCTKMTQTWYKNRPKMAPRWLLGGPWGHLGGKLAPRWSQEGSKVEELNSFPHVGAQVGTPFSTCSAPGWFTKGLETHLDDMLCPDTKF